MFFSLKRVMSIYKLFCEIIRLMLLEDDAKYDKCRTELPAFIKTIMYILLLTSLFILS